MDDTPFTRGWNGPKLTEIGMIFVFADQKVAAGAVCSQNFTVSLPIFHFAR
jgi:hypothetical protein